MNYLLYLFVYHIKNNKNVFINSYKHNTGRDDRFINYDNIFFDNKFLENNKSGFDNRFTSNTDLDKIIIDKCNEDLKKQYILNKLESSISIIQKKNIAEDYLKYNKNLYYDLFLGLDYFL
jgi:hypothetical protein